MVDSDCPSREQLSAYLLGNLAEQEADRLTGHIAACPSCQSTIQDLKSRSERQVDRLRQTAQLREPEAREAAARVHPAGTVGTGLPEMSATDADGLEQLGEYRLLEELGRGGMGTVYRALHAKLERVVALKVLPRERMADDRAVGRFHREMKAVGALDHPNIVRATDAGEADGTHFLVMEYIEGFDLAEVVDRCGPLETAEACELIRQAALGLECARAHGLVHRDVKPSNLMLTSGAQVKLLDLGLARFQVDPPLGEEMTATGQTMGTADYMAPEQVSDTHSVDIRADIYSLGCTLYKLLVGHPPFAGPDYQGTFSKMTAHVNEPVPPLGRSRGDVPDGLAEVLKRMVAKSPDDRYGTPAEVAEALAPFAAGADLPALFSQSRAGSRAAAPTPTALAATDEYYSSALASTHPGRPTMPATTPTVAAAAASARRWKPPTIAVALLLLVGGAGLFYEIIFVLRKDKNETVLRVPDGSDVQVRPDGQVEVTLPDGRNIRESIEPRPDPVDKPAAKPAVATDAKPVPPPPTQEKPVQKEPAKKEPVKNEVPPKEAASKPIPKTAKMGELRKSTAERIVRQSVQLPPGTPMSRIALVTKPAIVAGTRSWTIETRTHRGSVDAVAYSPDGRLTATGGSEGAVRLWTADTAELTRVLVGHDGKVQSLAFSPDGSVLASASSDRTIRLWDVKAGLTLRTLRGHLGAVYSVGWSSDGTLLASAAADKTIRLWDVGSGKTLATLRGHGDEVQVVRWSPNGLLLASGGLDQSAVIWDVESGKPLGRLDEQEAPVRDIAWSPDNKRLAVATDGRQGSTSIKIWDVVSSEVVQTFPPRPGGDRSITFSPDGQLLATSGSDLDDEVRILDVSAGEMVHSLKKPRGSGSTRAMAFSPDGTTLVAGNSRGTVAFWEALSGRALRLLPAHAGSVARAIFSPDEKQLACGFSDGTVRLWESDSGELVQLLRPELGPVRRMAWSADAKKLAVSYQAGTLVDLWDLPSGKRATQFQATKGPIDSLAFSPDGKRIATGGVQGELWDVESGEPIGKLMGQCNALAWPREGDLLAVAAGGDVRIFPAGSGKIERTLYGAKTRLREMAFSPDATVLAAAEETKIYLWDMKSGRMTATLTEHGTPPTTLAWMEDGVTLLSGSQSEVCVWQTKLGELARSMPGDGGAFAPNSLLLASRGPSTVQLRRLEDGLPVRTIVALAGPEHFALTPDGHVQGSPAADKELVYVVLSDSGQELLTPGQFAGRSKPKPSK